MVAVNDGASTMVKLILVLLLISSALSTVSAIPQTHLQSGAPSINQVATDNSTTTTTTTSVETSIVTTTATTTTGTLQTITAFSTVTSAQTTSVHILNVTAIATVTSQSTYTIPVATTQTSTSLSVSTSVSTIIQPLIKIEALTSDTLILGDLGLALFCFALVLVWVREKRKKARKNGKAFQTGTADPPWPETKLK